MAAVLRRSVPEDLAQTTWPDGLPSRPSLTSRLTTPWLLLVLVSRSSPLPRILYNFRETAPFIRDALATDKVVNNTRYSLPTSGIKRYVTTQETPSLLLTFHCFEDANFDTPGWNLKLSAARRAEEPPVHREARAPESARFPVLIGIPHTPVSALTGSG